MAEQVRQLTVTESDLLGLILKSTKPSKYIILDIETGEFESNGTKKGYARLVVADSECSHGVSPCICTSPQMWKMGSQPNDYVLYYVIRIT